MHLLHCTHQMEKPRYRHSAPHNQATGKVGTAAGLKVPTMPPYVKGQPVNLRITGRTPLGYHVMVENAHPGLLYHTAGAAPFKPGQQVPGFVCKVRLDGKIDLSLDTASHKRVPPLMDVILLALQKNNGQLAFDDSTPPPVIRDTFGVSKNAFKLALSTLYKQRRIRFTHPGIALAPKPSKPAGGR